MGDESVIGRGAPSAALCRRFPCMVDRLGPRPSRLHALPFCGHSETKVIDSRLAARGVRFVGGGCLECTERFTTFETAELLLPTVVKSDRSREPFDENKLPRQEC